MVMLYSWRAAAVWERTGSRTYRALYKFFSFDANGALTRSTEVTRTLEVGVKNAWIATAGTIKIFDADGNQTSASNCVAEEGERVSID